VTFYDRRREWERREIERAIKEAGSIPKAAKALGIDRAWCYQKCRRLGIDAVKQGGLWAMHGV
jgi:transcriptional regulator of acetoin/glycerol metabolism